MAVQDREDLTNPVALPSTSKMPTPLSRFEPSNPSLGKSNRVVGSCMVLMIRVAIYEAIEFCLSWNHKIHLILVVRVPSVV